MMLHPTKQSIELARRLIAAGEPLALPPERYMIHREPGNQVRNRREAMDYPTWYLTDDASSPHDLLLLDGTRVQYCSDISVREVLSLPILVARVCQVDRTRRIYGKT